MDKMADKYAVTAASAKRMRELEISFLKDTLSDGHDDPKIVRALELIAHFSKKLDATPDNSKAERVQSKRLARAKTLFTFMAASVGFMWFGPPKLSWT